MEKIAKIILIVAAGAVLTYLSFMAFVAIGSSSVMAAVQAAFMIIEFTVITGSALCGAVSAD